MATGRRSSGRRSTGGPVNYAEPVLVDDEDDEMLQDDDSKQARQEQIKKELAAARLAKKKRDEDDADFGKLTKKEKKKKKKAKQVEYKGKLSNIFTLPMDLLSTIFSELDPLDLLHLSRANKQLNQFLDSREAIPIWSISRRNLELYVPKAGVYDYYGDRISEETYETVQMPTRPTHLTETAYARLLFENECSNCDGKVLHTDYALGIKLCKTCRKDSIVKKHVAVDALKAGKKKAVVEEIVFSLVSQPYAYRSDAYYLPAIISLHDEIKDKKRKLRKKGEYDAWLAAKKEELEEQDKASQSRAVAIRDWLPRFKQYGRLDTRRAERAKYQQILKRKEEKEAARAVLAANRLPAIQEYASREPWYNGPHWNAFIESTSGKRLMHKATEFSEAEWNSIKASLEAEMVARKAFADSLADWNRKGAMRSCITARAAVDIPSTIHALKGSMNIAGELLALPAVAPLLDLQAPVHDGYGTFDDDVSDDEYYYDAGDRAAREEYRANREMAWKEALPDIIVQLRDRQIWILSDLVDKLAAKGTVQKTAAQILDTLGHDPDASPVHVKVEKEENGPEEALQRVKELQQAHHPQVRALRALYAALTDLRAVFSCRTCKPRRWESEAVLKIQTALSHTHFIHETRERKYDPPSTITSYERLYGRDAPLTVPVKWRSEDVVHFPSAGPAIDLLLAAIAEHNEVTRVKQEETAAAEAAALAKKANAASRAATDGDADRGSTKSQSSDEDDIKPLISMKPSVGIVVGPKTLADIVAFDAKYRFICTKNQNCDRRVPWQKKVYKKLQRNWDAMTVHLMDHIHAAQDAEEILITVSSIGIVRKTAYSDHPYM